MTKELSAEIRAVVRTRGYQAGRDIVMGELAFPSLADLTIGKPTMETLAIQNAFNAGAKAAFEALESLGRLPKSKQVTPKTRHLKLED